MHRSVHFYSPVVNSGCDRIFGIAPLESHLLINAVGYTIQSKTRGDQPTFRYQSRLAKPIIDQIDTVLARHYGFTDEELDYIINYDIKYRMGDELNADDEGED